MEKITPKKEPWMCKGIIFPYNKLSPWESTRLQPYLYVGVFLILVIIRPSLVPNVILKYDEIVSKGDHFFSSSDGSDLKEEKDRIRHFMTSLPFHNWSISCLILSLVLIASLCMYLAARQAKLSWMKSNEIPYLIVFFIVSLIVTQTISTIYSAIYILMSDLCHTLLFISAFVILTKQYRKLLMVINWSIVDLQINRNIHL